MSRALRRLHGLVLLPSLVGLIACSSLGIRPERDFSWETDAAPVWPMRSVIASPFQPTSRPRHQGIDLVAAAGTPVVAIRPGEVLSAEVRGSWETVVVLDHGDDVTSVYANLRETRVNAGDTVERGEVVGRLGDRGFLHFEIRRVNRPMNPQEFYELAPPPPVQETPPEADVTSEPAGSPLEIPVAVPSPTPDRDEPTPTPTVEILAPTPTPVEPSPTPAPPRPSRTPPPARTERAAPAPSPEVTRDDRRGAAPREVVTFRDVGDGLIALFANVGYVPMKLAYAGVGAVSGTMAYILTQDRQVASELWWPSLGGDFWVDLDHVRGTRPLRFAGDWPEEEPAAGRRTGPSP